MIFDELTNLPPKPNINEKVKKFLKLKKTNYSE